MPLAHPVVQRMKTTGKKGRERLKLNPREMKKICCIFLKSCKCVTTYLVLHSQSITTFPREGPELGQSAVGLPTTVSGYLELSVPKSGKLGRVGKVGHPSFWRRKTTFEFLHRGLEQVLLTSSDTEREWASLSLRL